MKRYKDDGWKYENLSYRGKFFRTLWMIPVVILTLYLLHLEGKAVISTGIVLIIILIAQAVGNYIKWKEEEDKD